jgi:hypothetical protein
MSDFDFSQLDLSEYEVDSGEERLRAGRYICKVTEAKVEPMKSKNGYTLVLRLEDKVTGHGSIPMFITVKHSKSAKAQQIGLAQVKTLATHGGLPNPDKVGDVKNLVGLEVGVKVSPEPWTDDNGEERTGSAVDKWHPFFDPAKGATGPDPVETKGSDSVKTPPPPKADPFDDDIPF